MDDAFKARALEVCAERGSLGASQRAKAEALEVAVQQALRVFDLGVPYEVDPGQC